MYEPVEFNYRQSKVSNEIKELAYDLESILDKNVANCREKSLAITKLEEFLMWTNRAIATNCIKLEEDSESNSSPFNK